ncbi:MAG TPA: hypothetical protein VFD92_09375 [Candidatus Binatia bacterium]|nr:hypothetical protein [Candidatus Binatia bacterium]
MSRLFLGFGLLALLSSAALAFSDDELRAIYVEMKQAGGIQCGMTLEHLIGRYRNCAPLGGTTCDGSLIVVTEKGQCVDSLQFQGLDGPDAVVVLNGEQYPKRASSVPASRKKPADVDS